MKMLSLQRPLRIFRCYRRLWDLSLLLEGLTYREYLGLNRQEALSFCVRWQSMGSYDQWPGMEKESIAFDSKMVE